MSKRYDVVALGELLIDFIPTEKCENNMTYEAYEGGAPANVLSMISRIGGKTAFIGKVGNDGFGAILKNALIEQKIDDLGLVTDSNYCTTLAFVNLDKFNERSFTFCRKPGADMMLSVEDVNFELIKKTNIFHFGTLSLTNEPVIEATKTSVKKAKENNCLISFDPNIRELLWDNLSDAVLQMKYGLDMCDILKVSEEELFLVTDSKDMEESINEIASRYPNIKLIFVTCGSNGSYFRFKDTIGKMPAFTEINVIDTTGAGDAFFGCCLFFISKLGIENLSEEKLYDIVEYANAAGALVVSKKGAFRQMPNNDEIKLLIDNVKRKV